jgi:Tfp pilus assembly protein PilW
MSPQRPYRAARGQSLVELAIWLPLAIVLIVGTVQGLVYAYDRAMLASMHDRALTGAAQDAGETPTFDAQLADDARRARLDVGRLWVRVATPGDEGEWHLLADAGTGAAAGWHYAPAAAPGSDVRVALHYSVTLRVPFIGARDVGLDTSGLMPSLSYRAVGAAQ